MLSVLFVDADAAPGGNGLSWGSAYADLQSALDRAGVLQADGDPSNDIGQIWIAEGVYRPTAELESGDPRTATFSLVDGVALYGGFSGTEAALADRDPAAYETVLSGDIGRLGDNADNAYSVLYCGEGVGAVLDGVTVAEGNADGPYSPEFRHKAYGGGIFNAGTLHVAHALLTDNVASSAGAICNVDTLYVSDSALLGNVALGSGGAISTSNLATVTNTTLSNNTAGNRGGAIVGSETLLVFDSVISENTAAGYGGGIYNSGQATVTNCSLRGNRGTTGGGVYNDEELTIVGSTVAGNRVVPSQVEHPEGGIDNCESLTIFNTTIAGNDGHGISTTYEWARPSTAVLKNSILALNTKGAPRTVFFVESSNNLIGADPGFIRDPGTNGPDDCGDLRLTARSPAIDGGDLAALPADVNDLDQDGDTAEPLPLDPDGNPRVYAGAVDIGAFEFQASSEPNREAPSLKVTTSEDVFDLYDGRISLREAVYYAATGSLGTRVTFAQDLGGATCFLNGYDIGLDHAVVIDATGLLGGLTIDAGNQSRIFTVGAEADQPVKLIGLTLQNGRAYHGGAIYNAGTLSVFNCLVRRNLADEHGGGIYDIGTLDVAYSTFVGNHAYRGTCIYTNGASLNGIIAAANRKSTPDIYVESGTVTGSRNLIEYAYDLGGIVDGYDGNMVGRYADTPDPGFFQTPDDGWDGWGDDPATPIVNESLNDDYGDLRLLPGSVARDSGDNGLLPADEFDADGDGDTAEPIPFDVKGNPRVAGATVDRGALEAIEVEYESILRVDAAAAPDGEGTSWGSAFDNLESALNVAAALNADADSENDIDAIWIAEGTYKPGPTFRSEYFQLVDGVTLYGGFNGSETVLGERDWSAHETILSGDIGIVGDSSDNAYTVVYCDMDDSAALDGLTVTRGYASESGSDMFQSRGGGIVNRGTLSLRNVQVRENLAERDGGGICNLSGTLTIEDSMFTENRTLDKWGGGGGIRNWGGTVHIVNSFFADNSTERRGGAISSEDGEVRIVSSTISDNKGVAVYGDSSTIEVFDSVIRENEGGAIQMYSGSLTVSGSSILGNTAEDGGGICCIGSEHLGTVANSTIAGNVATGVGGGIYLSYGRLDVIQSTVAGNSAMTGGGIYAIDNDAELTLSNSIVAENGDCNLVALLSANSSNNLIAVDPRFVRDPRTNGADDYGDLRLTSSSAAIDAGAIHLLPPDLTDADDDGDTAEPLPLDSAGAARIYGDAVDIGAFELQEDMLPGRETPSTIVTTAEDVFDLYDGRTSLREAVWYARPESPGTTITFALALAGSPILVDGSSIHVERSVTVSGFSEEEPVTIDAGRRSRIFTVAAPADQPVQLWSLKLINGYADSGGAVKNVGASLDLTHCTLTENAARGYSGSGGAIAGFHGVLTVNASVFSENTIHGSGGGAAIYCNHGSVRIDHSRFHGNIASGSSAAGGAICISGDTAHITNSLVVGNAAISGGGVYISSATATVANLTLSGNDASDQGGGLYVGMRSTVAIHNSLIAGNTAGELSDIHLRTDTYPSSLSGSHNVIGDGSGQSYLIDGENGNRVGTAEAPVDPRFVRNPSDGGDGWGDNPLTGDFDESENDDLGDLRLGFFSPALDAGDPALAVDSQGTPLQFDVFGGPRAIDGNHDTVAIVDIGAVETVPNHAPVFLPIGDKTVDEGALLSFTVAAEDSQDDPANGIRLSARRLPPGATFDPASGFFSWIPDGDQSGTYEVAFTATDDGGPPLWTSETITITVHDAQTPLVGDLNADARVNSADLDLIRSHWGQSVTPGDLLAGDPSGDGVVGAADLDIVRANWGKTAAADAVFDALGEAPAYGPAEEYAALGPDSRLTPRRWEALAWETLASEASNREKSDRSVPRRLVFLSDLAWLG